MIFIFTITIIGPIETGKLNPKKETVFCTLFCLMSFFFFIVITKRKKKYITIIIKRRVGEGEREREKKKLRNITTGKQSQHSTSTYLRREMKRYKNENKKKNKRIWQKEKIKEIGTYEVKYNKQLKGTRK